MFALPLPPAARAAEQSGIGAVTVQVNAGFSETVRIGHWSPVTITVSNDGADVAGRLELDVPSGDALSGGRFTTTVRRPLELPGGSRKRFRFTVYLESIAEPLLVRVLDGGRTLVRQRLDLRARTTSARLLLVLGRDLDLDYLNRGERGPLRVAYPHPDLLPERWQGYDGVAALVLHGLSLERLSAGQFRAMEDWIAQGGRLVVSGGPDYPLLRTPRLASLLPAVPAGLVRVPAASVEGVMPFARADFDAHRLAAVRGRVLLRSDDWPLAVEHTVGRGRVLYLAFDVSRPPFTRWQGMRGLWWQLLRLPAEESLAAQLAERPEQERAEAFTALADTRFPPRIAVFLTVAFYLALLLLRPPVSAPHGVRAVLLVWGRPLLFALGVGVLFGRLLFPPATSLFLVGLLQPHGSGHRADLTVQAAWYATGAPGQRLEYAGASPAFRPLTPPGARAVDWVLDDGPRPAARPRRPRGYAMNVIEGADVVAYDVEARLFGDAEAPRLRVENRSGAGFSAAWLVWRERVHVLGAVPEGGAWVQQLGAHEAMLDTGGAPWFGALLRAPRADARQTRLAHALLQARRWPAPGEGEALLVALTRNPLRVSGESVSWSRRETGLLLMEVTVEVQERGARGR